MTTHEAVALRQRLELDLLALLQQYQDSTGLTPSYVEVQLLEGRTLADPPNARSFTLAGVRVTVQL